MQLLLYPKQENPWYLLIILWMVVLVSFKEDLVKLRKL
jgi:hypothetical protein